MGNKIECQGRLLYDCRADRLYVYAHGLRTDALECGDKVNLFRAGEWATVTVAHSDSHSWYMAELPGIGASGLMCAMVKANGEWRPEYGGKVFLFFKAIHIFLKRMVSGNLNTAAKS